MLSSLATISADKFIKKIVARMFEHAQTFFGNICCSAVCFSVWPHCRATIHLNFRSKKNQHTQCCISVALQNSVLDSINIKWPVKVEDLKLIVQNGKKTLERKNSVERIKRYCLKQVQVQVF